MNYLLFISILSFGCSICVFAQTRLPSDEMVNGKLVSAAFEPQREILQQSSAVIYTDEKSRIKSVYGVVVSDDGYILTKASEIEGKEFLSVRVGRDLFEGVELVEVNGRWDLALLKVNSDITFEPIVFSESDEVVRGHWVISNGSTLRSKRRVRVGVISAHTRIIHSAGSDVVLGVSLDDKTVDEVKIVKVFEDSGAQKAGLSAGDIIREVGGASIANTTDIFDSLAGKKDGESIEVVVLRGDDEKTFVVEVKSAENKEKMVTRNDQMSGEISNRRDGFPRVIDHDTPLSNVSVGGPLLTLDGMCIGMNIARASRVATFAIPALELRALIEEMIPKK